MANTLTALERNIIARATAALRSNSIMPRLVASVSEEAAREPGDTVMVPIPQARNVKDVAPSSTPDPTTDVSVERVPVVLNKWKFDSIHLTDKERREISQGLPNVQLTSMMEALAKQVDLDILANYPGIYAFSGTAGTNPFARVQLYGR